MNRAPFRISPDARIDMIQHSLRCFGYGVASALAMLLAPLAVVVVANVHASNRAAAIVCALPLPFISLLMAVKASSDHRKARIISSGEWNPARPQLLWGRALSALGILCSLLLLFFFAAAWINFFD